ncbi:MAG: 50S ribosomal protein L1 [Thiotrichales bacterium]|nr:50S ribosomal protein L1 [Thiotrichales bacterium]
MTASTKRRKDINEKIEHGRFYPVAEALQLLKECSKVKFDESVEVAINLGIDARKSDQQVRGSTVLPKGTGKTVRVAVFAQGELADTAREAGADEVGFEDLAETMQKGDIAFDVVIATPDAMAVVGKLGKVLGPRGLMPNPKVGTVTKDVKQAVENAKAGQVRYRTDKNGIIHCAIGKVSFDVGALQENLDTLLHDLVKAKPGNAKGVYMKKVSLSTTMGPGILVDQGSLSL